MMFLALFLFNLDYTKLVDNYETAHQLFLQENYGQAAAFFRKILGEFEGSEFEDEIRFRYAECLFNLKDYENARREFETILKRGQNPYLEPECLYSLGMVDILQFNYREAETVLQRLLKNPAYQQEERANFALGVLYYFRGDFKEAREKLEGLALIEAKFYYGKALSRLGHPLEAITVFKQIIGEAPNTPIATLAEFSRAEALFFNRDFDGARLKFADYIVGFPTSPLADYAHFFLAAAMVHAREYAAASEHLLPLTRHADNLLAAHAGYFLGICRMNLGDGLGAASSFQRVRANYPNTQISTYANLQLTNALLAAGDTVEALTSASQLATMFATGELASVGDYLTGMIYFQRLDYFNAARSFENLLKNYPASLLREPAAAMFLYSCNNLREYDRAITVGSKYLRDFPEFTGPWRGRTLYFLGDAYYYRTSYPEAEKCYLQVTKEYFGLELTPYAKLGLGYALYHQDRAAEANQIFESMRTVPFDDSSLVIAVYLGLGYALFNQAQYEKALDPFEALVNTFPKDERSAVPALFYAGLCYYNIKAYGNAVETWEKLVGTYPLSVKAAEAGFRTGDTYFKAQEYEKARSIFRWTVENHPENEYARTAQLTIAQSYYNQQQYDEAIREFQKFLDLYPTTAEAAAARKGMEMCYYQKGLASAEDMERFVAKFPSSEYAAEGQYQIANKQFDDKNYSRALDEYLKVTVNFPASSYAADALLLAAECAVNLESWTRATELYKRYLSYFPQGKQRDGVFFNLGTAYYNQKEYGLALASFNTVIDSFPESSYAQSCRHNLGICQKLLGEPGTVPAAAAPETTGIQADTTGIKPEKENK